MVIIDMSMSLDGFVAGPDDGPDAGLGKRGGEHIFDWFTSGTEQIGESGVFSPEPGVNRQIVEEMISSSGCMPPRRDSSSARTCSADLTSRSRLSHSRSTV